jgi:hypothetical protein
MGRKCGKSDDKVIVDQADWDELLEEQVKQTASAKMVPDPIDQFWEYFI